MNEPTVSLRCPDCGSLLAKSSPRNLSTIEVRCRKCKQPVGFEGLRPRPTGQQLDAMAQLR